MKWITENWAELLVIANTTILLASYISKLTPTNKDDKFFAKLAQIMSISKK